MKRYTIKQAVEATGLEESLIRYYERIFKEFLTFTSLDQDKNTFTEDHVDLLKRIKSLVHSQGYTLEQVKRDLKAALDANGGRPPTSAPNGTANGVNGHANGTNGVNGHANGANGTNGHANGANGHAKPNGAAAENETIHDAAPNGAAPKRKRMARVISVTSGKGGVGKTTVTVNLAIAFAQMGKRVAIFDADLGLANVHILLGVKPRFNMRHVIEDNFKLDDVITEGPLGIKIISGGQGVREMANLTSEQRRVMLRQLDRVERDVDILLVDTGAGISDNVLRFATFADEVIVVTTPNIASAADAYSIIKIITEMEPNSKIGVIANQVESMYHSKNVFNRINIATVKYLNREMGDLGYIIDDPTIKKSNQSRKPLLLDAPECEAACNLRMIAETILQGEVFRNKIKESGFEDLMGALKRTVVGV